MTRYVIVWRFAWNRLLLRVHQQFLFGFQLCHVSGRLLGKRKWELTMEWRRADPYYRLLYSDGRVQRWRAYAHVTIMQAIGLLALLLWSSPAKAAGQSRRA